MANLDILILEKLFKFKVKLENVKSYVWFVWYFIR